MTALHRRLTESTDTFVLVFAGTGAIVTNALTGAVILLSTLAGGSNEYGRPRDAFAALVAGAGA